jgi:dipeptidyl-peptidase III
VAFGTAWVQNDATVDFDNGFIEVYRDARGAKGSSQSFVTITDKPVTTAMKNWRKTPPISNRKLPGTRSTSSPVQTSGSKSGRNPDRNRRFQRDHDRRQSAERKRNPREIRLEEFSLHQQRPRPGRSHRQDDDAEFAAGPAEIERSAKYGTEAHSLMTALHEVIGHGSGKLSERVSGGAQPFLKEYFSTLEEARADLMALWNVWDPKLKELGLISNQEEVAKAMYDSAASCRLDATAPHSPRRHD